MHRLLFFTLFLGCAVVGSGQVRTTLDSLQEIDSDAEKFDSLVSLSIASIDDDMSVALRAIQNAVDLGWVSGDSGRIVEGLRIKGQILYRLERSGEAIETFQRARSIATRRSYKQELMMISNTFGSTYLFRSQFDKALRQYFTAYELAQALARQRLSFFQHP